MTATAVQRLDLLLNRIDINKLSRQTGFVKRKARKAPGDKFLRGFLNAVFCSETSLMSIAFSIGQYIDDSLSKVAVWKRLNRGFVLVLEHLLTRIISEKLSPSNRISHGDSLASFSRVFIQDSTILTLPDKFHSVFAGSGTNTGKKKAMLKVQLVYDMLAERFARFNLTTYAINDQKASANILSMLKTGDLILRDMGYFSLPVFSQIHNKGAYFLSRLSYSVNVYSQQNDEQIDLPQYIKKQIYVDRSAQHLDIDIYTGAKHRLSSRLIVIPLPDAVANKRRRKARIKQKDPNIKYDQAYMFLLGFNIFITNVGRNICTAQQIAQIYRLRWRIEIIFKSWKSHFRITDIPHSNPSCVKAFIYALLIYVTLTHAFLYLPCYNKSHQQQHKYPSLLKIAKWTRIISGTTMPGANTKKEHINSLLQYHGAYEQRNRISYSQRLAMI